MLGTLLFLLIILPFLAALGCYLFRMAFLRSLLVVGSGVVLTVCSLALIGLEPFEFKPPALLWLNADIVVSVLDFALLFLILYIGFRLKNNLIKFLAALQIVVMAYLELFMMEHGASHAAIRCDTLSLVMVLIISIIGSLICIYGLPYMRKHEQHLNLPRSRQPRFFAFMLVLLGAMNGLVLSNDLLYFYFFFEITTLCSFLLVRHDLTDIAKRNAERILWMNSVGGACFALAMMWMYPTTKTLELSAILQMAQGSNLMLWPLALLILAAFTKAAQTPFQSWLTGAMVAPTPVSALLHSSTMVKAGVYLAVRLAPAYHGTFLSTAVALFGAFVFMTTAALAMGQSNAKKVLAYSTISNLGLIFACAGLNTSAAITAAILLIIFHAISKALMFMCVGTIEQKIHSRDIEDMRGIFGKMPLVAMFAFIGALSMLLPPFGVLLSKWMAIEAAANNIFVIAMVAVGSAFTVVFWTRWAGVMSNFPSGRPEPDHQPFLTIAPLGLMTIGAIGVSIFAPWIYSHFVSAAVPAGADAYKISAGVFTTLSGAFWVYPLVVLMAAATFLALRAARKSRNDPHASPYLSGLTAVGPKTFIGPMDKPVNIQASNYYMLNVFGEEKLTMWVNMGALILLAILLGGAL
ncbi:MAG: ech hydrogenase subunit [Desulfovibrionales bacterium]|nr:ech hydrogenase subunit [Desulfovibrionales bacterium]